MRNYHKNSKIKYYIGDVRVRSSIKNAMSEVDYVLNNMALRQLRSCEFFPMEALRTNVFGTDNIPIAAAEAGIKKVN